MQKKPTGGDTQRPARPGSRAEKRVSSARLQFVISFFNANPLGVEERLEDVPVKFETLEAARAYAEAALVNCRFRGSMADFCLIRLANRLVNIARIDRPASQRMTDVSASRSDDAPKAESAIGALRRQGVKV